MIVVGGVGQGARAADEIQVLAQGVTPAFPDHITFTLTAASRGAVISEARLLYRPLASDISSLAVVPVQAGQRVTLSYELDMRGARYLPPGMEIAYYWSLQTADGQRIDLPAQRFLYQDGRFQWRTVQGGLVTVHYYAGNDDFGQDLLATAQRTLDRLGQRFGLRGDQPMHLVIYGNNRDFASSLPPNSAEWIGGEAHPNLGLIVTGIQPGTGAAAEVRRVLPHEVSHLLLYQATENPYGGPAHWLDEGLAVYNQETPDSSLQPIFDQAVKKGALLPVRALNSNFPLDPNQARLSYAQSLSIVTYLINTYGDAKLGALFQAFHDELSYDEALQRVYGFDTDGLDREWKASLGYRGDQPGAVLTMGAGPDSTPTKLIRMVLPEAAFLFVGAIAFAAVAYTLRQRQRQTQQGETV